MEFSHGKMELRREILLAILKVGLPTATQMVVVNTAYLLVTGMLNPFGTAVAAASGVGLKINTFAGMHCWAIGQAITAMVGQCVGAGQIRRARQVVRSGLLLNLAVTAAVVVTVQFLAEPLIRLFDSTSPGMIRVGVLYLRLCCGVNSLVYAAMYTLDSFAIGVGAAHVAMVNALLDAVVVRLPVGWLLAFPSPWAFPESIWARPFRLSCPLWLGSSTSKAESGKEKRWCVSIWERSAETNKRRKRI